MLEQLVDLQAAEAAEAVKATATQQLRRIVQRQDVWPEDCGALQVAARALGVDPADPLEDHPLAVLCQVLCPAEAGAVVLLLGREQCALLTEATNRLDVGASV